VSPRRVVAVLSGGGAKAAAHVGAVRALREAGLAPTRFIGTSMGAAVAAGFAAGLGPEELVERMIRIGPAGIVRSWLAPWAGLWLRSLLRGDRLRGAIAELVPARSFAELAIPLTVTAVDLDTGALVSFGADGRDAPLVDVLHASASLPLFYPPVTLEGRRLTDGGLRGVLPLGVAADVPADLVVAVDIGPGFDETPPSPAATAPPLVAIHTAAMAILMASNTEAQLALWRADPGRPELLYVRPRMDRAATFLVRRAREFAEEGYRATQAALAARAGHP
jgi:NTE family protein